MERRRQEEERLERWRRRLERIERVQKEQARRKAVEGKYKVWAEELEEFPLCAIRKVERLHSQNYQVRAASEVPPPYAGGRPGFAF